MEALHDKEALHEEEEALHNKEALHEEEALNEGGEGKGEVPNEEEDAPRKGGTCRTLPMDASARDLFPVAVGRPEACKGIRQRKLGGGGPGAALRGGAARRGGAA